MISGFATDLRLAVRSLVKARAFSLTAIVTLGLAMALAVAVLVVANAYLFRTLPYPEARRLYTIRYAPPGGEQPRNLEALDWRALDDLIEHPIAWDLDVFYLIGGGQAEAAPGAWVTPGFVEGLGIRPAIGRGFDESAFRQGSAQVALISHRLWQQRFGGAADVLGRGFTAYVSDRPHEAETFTIIGVLPPGFWHVNTYTDVIVPLRAATYPYMIRLREGVSAEAAAARLSAFVRSGAPGLPAGWSVELLSTHEAYVARVRPVLRPIAVAAGLVLLVAWGNVTALLLIRATRRRREIAVRLALGARRLTVARFLVLEAVLLVAVATLIGLAASALAMQGAVPLIERELGRPAPGGASAFAVDASVVLMAGVGGLLVALAAGLAPLAASWRANLLQPLQSGSRSATESAGTQRTRSILIALQVAASVALLTAAALMTRSVVQLLRVDFGIRATDMVSASMTLRQKTYPDAPSQAAFFARVLSSLDPVPGVRSAAITDWWPLYPRPPRRVQAADATAAAAVLSVSPDYFATLGIPLHAGRSFGTADRPGSEPVAVVSETIARRLFPDGGALGSRIAIGGEDAVSPRPAVAAQVVGIAGDVRQTPDDVDPADVYLPLPHAPGRFAWVHVHTADAPGRVMSDVRTAIAAIDADVTLSAARPLEAAIDEQLSRPRFLASLLGVFGGVSALLALVGIYGIVAYAVRQREREIAVRVALGAEPSAITSLFVRHGAVVLAAGLAPGVLAAMVAGRMLQSQLFGVRPADPTTLAATAAAFAAAGLLAVWWPARRAAATDPAIALREE